MRAGKLIRLILLPSAIVLTSCGGSARQPLDDLLAFRDPRTCEPAPDFQRLLDSLLVTDSSGERLRLGAPQLAPRFLRRAGEPVLENGSSGEQTVTIPLRGTWRGLPVVAVRRTAKAETDWVTDVIVFNASRQAVLEAANVAGFDLPPSGRRTVVGELDTTIGVTGDGTTAQLWCGT